MMQQNSRFAFLDEGEALRRLGLDRDTLLALVREKRIRAYPGVGKGNFYRQKDIEALYAELHADTGQDPAAAGEGEETAAPGRKLFDPAYKVHVRLQADLKWYDLEEQDLEAWVRELHADGYVRQRANITRVIETLTRLVTLMDQAAANWQVLEAPTPSTPPGVTGKRAASSRGKPLPMAGDASTTPQ
jgi:hypothetical protein